MKMLNRIGPTRDPWGTPWDRGRIKGTASHRLPPAIKVAPEPCWIDAIPREFRQEDVVIDAVEGATQVY